MADVLYGGSISATNTAGLGVAPFPFSAVDGTVANRIRVNGNLTQIKVRCDQAKPELAGVVVRVWRDLSADNLDCRTLVGSSTVPSNVIPALEWTTLDTPIPCRAGDAVGLQYTTAAGLAIYSSTGRKLHYESAAKTNGDAWANTSADYGASYEFRGTAPQIITYGDSISTGVAGNTDVGWAGSLSAWSGLEFYSSNENDITYDYSQILRDRLGGAGAIAAGEPTRGSNWGEANYAANVTPYASAGAILLCNWGINDIIVDGATYAGYEGKWDSILAQSRVDGLRLVRQEIMYVRDGYTYGGHDAAYWNAIVDTWNASMATWCAANGVKNIRINRKWQAAWIGATDNIHPVLAGYKAIAKVVKQKLKGGNKQALLLP